MAARKSYIIAIAVIALTTVFTAMAFASAIVNQIEHIETTPGADGASCAQGETGAQGETDATGVLGLATEAINNGEQGYVTTYGLVRGISTVGFAAGDPLYLGSNGSLTNVWPNNGIVVQLGYVVDANSSSGSVYVNPQPDVSGVGSYGSFYDTSLVSLSANTATPIPLGTTDLLEMCQS